MVNHTILGGNRMTAKENKDLSVKEFTKAAKSQSGGFCRLHCVARTINKEERLIVEKYDISQKIVFKTGTYELNSDANFNFQLNRVIMWDGGDADEIMTVSPRIKTSSDWVKGMICPYVTARSSAEESGL